MANNLEHIYPLKNELNLLDVNNLVISPIERNFQKINYSILNLTSGTYTPTLTNTTNITGSTAYSVPWSRNGNVITVTFQVDIDPTAAAPTLTVLTFTLPIACRSTPTGSGSGCGPRTVSTQAGVISMASTTTATYSYMAVDAANTGHGGTFQYVIN